MPDWLAQTTGMTQGSALVLTVILALLFVIVLAVVLIPQLKRFARTSYKGSRSRQPRLAIMDATDLDARRRLLLVRRDNVEHLIMIGGANDVVVEQGIIRGVPVSTPLRGQMGTGQPATTQSFEQAPAGTEPSARLHWGDEIPATPEELKPAQVSRPEPAQKPEAKAPAQPATPAPAPAASTPPKEKPAPIAPPAPLRAAIPAAQASGAQPGKPAPLQTPTIGGTRGVQKLAARPITARPTPPTPARPNGFLKPMLKAVTPEQSTPAPEKAAPKPAAKPEEAKAEPQVASKPIPMAATTPPLNGPAAKAASAFMRPRVNVAPAKEQAPQKDEQKPQAASEKPVTKADSTAEKSAPKPQAAAAKPDQKPETTPKSTDKPKAEPATTNNSKDTQPKQPAEALKPAKPEAKADKPEAPKAAKASPKQNPNDAMDGIAKEMADLLDDIEANTK